MFLTERKTFDTIIQKQINVVPGGKVPEPRESSVSDFFLRQGNAFVIK